jgi:predicted ATPase/DNA-binding winged helix-turn-helix (wHTH) protein
MDERKPSSYAFGSFRLLPERRLLLRDGEAVRIGGRALDILTVLVTRRGEIVGKRELMTLVWPTLFVEEGNLKVNMNALRRVLGDAPDGTPHIATVIGRGYRFVAAVTVEAATEVSATPADLSRTSNLPIATTKIVGRQPFINAIHGELRDGRVVSIIGPGGIGKTTVALAVAEGEMVRYRDGVWLVDLSTLPYPALVATAISTALGLATHSVNMLEALCHHLEHRKVLLVLDNCEHVIDTVSQCIDRIVAASNESVVLTTSREPLRVRGERVRRLSELDLPDSATALTAAKALAFPAIQLFVDRALDLNEAFVLTDADAPDVAEICRRLDGLPLAIELAATHVEALGIGGLLSALEDRFSLLEGRRGGPERHRTLEATIDWSYNLLSPTEQSLMRRLSVFPGSFSLNSACGISIGVDRPAVTADLARLVAKSLLTAEVHEGGVEHRQFDSTRAYALDKLAASGELDAIRRRHAEHCLTLLGAAKADIERLSRDDWHARYAGKVDDVRAALGWAFENPATIEFSVKLTVAAIPFGQQFSLHEECRFAVDRVLTAQFAPYRGAADELLLHLTRATTILHSEGPRLEVKESLTRALALAEQSGDVALRLTCLRELSEYETWIGNYAAAAGLSEEIRELLSRDDPSAHRAADVQAGLALRWIGNLAESRRYLESVLDRSHWQRPRDEFSRVDRDLRMAARGSLAVILWLQGFPDRAVAMASAQRQEAEASSDAAAICSALANTAALVSAYVGDLAAMEKCLDVVETFATRRGLTIWNAIATCRRGRWLLDSGGPFDLKAYEDALAMLLNSGFRVRYGDYLVQYAEGQAQHGDYDAALATLEEALAFVRSNGQQWENPEWIRLRGNFIRQRARPGASDDAASQYRRSIQLAREQSTLSWELRSATSLVELERERGGDAAAEDMLSEVLGRFTEGFGTADLRRAQALIDSRTG